MFKTEVDIEEFCRSRLEKASEGKCSEAIREVRARLSSASAYEREHLHLTLAEIYAIKRDVANMMETIFVASATPTTLSAGVREVTIGRILSPFVPTDVVERRYRYGLSLQDNDKSRFRTQFLLGLLLMATERPTEGLVYLTEATSGMKNPTEGLEIALALEQCFLENDNELTDEVKEIATATAAALALTHCSSAADVARVNMARGILFDIQNDFERAAQAYGRVLAEPSDLFAGDLVVRLARLSERQEERERAVRRLEEGLHNRHCKYAFQLYNELCRLHDEAGRMKAVERVLKRAEQDERVYDVAALLMARANRLLDDGKEEEAKECLERAAESESLQATDSIIKLAELAAQKEDTETQLKHYDKLKPTVRIGLPHRLTIARGLEKAGRDEQALSWYRSLTANIPADSSILLLYETEASAVDKESLRTGVSHYRMLQNKTGTPLCPIELLKLGRLLLPLDSRNARSLLRQAAARGEPMVQVLALLLLGRLQLDSDPEVGLATLRRASTLVQDVDEFEKGEELYLLACACERTGREDEVGWNLRKAVKSKGLLSKAPANLDMARYWLRHGEPVRALAMLRKVAHFNGPESTLVLDSYRANALELAGDRRAASELYEVVTHSRDEKLVFHAHLCLAGLAGRKGLKAETANHLDKAMTAPTPWQKRLVRLLRGRYALRRNDAEAALAEYDLALWPTWKEFGVCLKLRGQALEKLQEKEGAARSMLTALIEFLAIDTPPLLGEPAGLSPLFLPDFLNLRASTSHELDKLRVDILRLGDESLISGDDKAVCESPEGIAGIRRLLKMLLDPEGPPLTTIYRKMADTFSEMGRKKDSRLCIRRAEIIGRGSLLERSEQSSAKDTKSEASFKGISIELLPSGSKVIEMTSLLQQGDKKAQPTPTIATEEQEDRAIKELERAVKNASVHERSRQLFGLANTLFDVRRFDEAAERYTQALLYEKCPQREDVQHNLGITWNELGQYAQAIEQFDAVLQTNAPSLKASCLYHKGNALLELGKLGDAAESYGQVLDLEDASLELRLYSLINLAHCKERTGDPFEAKRCLLEALGRSRQPGWIMLRLAALDANHGNFGGARTWKERAREEFLKDNDIFGLSKLREILKGI